MTTPPAVAAPSLRRNYRWKPETDAAIREWVAANGGWTTYSGSTMYNAFKRLHPELLEDQTGRAIPLGGFQQHARTVVATTIVKPDPTPDPVLQSKIESLTGELERSHELERILRKDLNDAQTIIASAAKAVGLVHDVNEAVCALTIAGDVETLVAVRDLLRSGKPLVRDEQSGRLAPVGSAS